MNSIINSTSGFYARTLNQLGELRGEIERLQGQIGTGERLQRSSQDPVAASRLRDIARSERLDEINVENAKRLELDLSQASDQIASVSDILARAKELAIAAGNDSVEPSAREAIATELGQLAEELLSRANSVSLTGEPLFSGEAGGAAYTRDAGGNVTYTGSATTESVALGEGVSIERGIIGPEFLSFDEGGTPTDAFALLSGLVAALQGGAPDPAAAARDAIGGFDNALDAANRGQTILGARLAWLETVQQNQVERSITRSEQGAEVGGADLAETITQLQQTLTVLEASQASFARVSSLTLFDAI